MLYKKYHRNYIRKFKKGIKICYKTYSGEIKDTVRIEPFYNDIKNKSIHITGSKYGWTLVYCNGRVDYKIKIEEHAHAIQEISQELR